MGDYIAHYDERDKGAITDATRDTYAIASWFIVYRKGFTGNIDLNNLPYYSHISLTATLSRFDNASLKKKSGWSKSNAHKMVLEWIRRFGQSDSGTFHLKIVDAKREKPLLQVLCTHMNLQPAFEQYRLFEDFQASLRSNGLLKKDEERDLRKLEPFVTLFAVSKMHDSRIKIENGDFVGLFVGVGAETKVEVLAASDFTYNGGPIRFGSAVFTTKLDAKTHLDSRLIAETQPWDFPIEVTKDIRLDRMR